MSTAPTHTCRRLRFSLRTLLLLVAVCAVATWIYLTGWPWLVAYWQQASTANESRYIALGCIVRS
jgi:hypothetical protein